MEFQLIVESTGYGVMCDGVIAVPCTHKTKEAAVDELVYYETLNFTLPKNRKFLDRCHTLVELDQIKKSLLSTQLFFNIK